MEAVSADFDPVKLRFQEGSTVIIEAAKGGHTEVVNLLLTYTNSIQYQQIIPDEQELSQSSPSQTSLDDQVKDLLDVFYPMLVCLFDA